MRKKKKGMTKKEKKGKKWKKTWQKKIENSGKKKEKILTFFKCFVSLTKWMRIYRMIFTQKNIDILADLKKCE